jgi:two-component system phosphate regulon sensor histidine kinase PhoR
MKKWLPWLSGSILVDLRSPVLAWTLFLLTMALPVSAVVYLASSESRAVGSRIRGETHERRVEAANKLRTDISLASLQAIEFLRGLPESDVESASVYLAAAPDYGMPFAARDGVVLIPESTERTSPASDAALREEIRKEFSTVRELDLLARTHVRPGSTSVQATEVDHKWIATRVLKTDVRIGWILDTRTIRFTANKVVGENLRIEPKAERNTESLAVPKPTVPNSVVMRFSSHALDADGATLEDATEITIREGIGARIVLDQPELLDRSVRREQKRIWVLSLGPALAFVLSACWLFWRARDAQQLANLRTDFVAAVSHELRTPLASVRMFAELLEAGEVADDERAEVEQALAGETRRLHATLDRMLRYGALARGKLVLSKSVQELRPIVVEAAHKRRVTIEVDPTLIANIDGGMLGLAIDNLLSNAVKYAPEGGPYVVRAREDGRDIVIDVVDRGPGLSKKALKAVFQPFERADNRLSKATEGSGVGLALVRGIAEAHGGSASVKSELGHGATFTLRLPRA